MYYHTSELRRIYVRTSTLDTILFYAADAALVIAADISSTAADCYACVVTKPQFGVTALSILNPLQETTAGMEKIGH